MSNAKEPISEESRVHPPVEGPEVSRRGFLGGLGGLAASAGAVGMASVSLPSTASAAYVDPQGPRNRRRAARLIREAAALDQHLQPYTGHLCNGDETVYSADYRNQYSKGLPHNSLGEVDPMAYDLMVDAISSGDFADWEAVPLGGTRKQVCPLGALSYEVVGPDSHHAFIPAAPAFNSAWTAGEMVEVYWQALLRDVSFADYGTDPMAAAAAADLTGMSDFRGPKVAGQVTTATLFRGFPTGDTVGPYISQFLWLNIPYGMISIAQKYDTIAAGDDRGVTYADWLAIQNGTVPGSGANLPGPNRYIINGRDLSQYVHFDFTYQAFLNAALILLGFGGPALADNNPYKSSLTQAAFVNFGGPEILDLVAKAGNCALKAAWFQKWGVHRRSRPESFGGRVHNQITGAKGYGIHPDVINSQAVAETFARWGTYLHAQAYPEGSPTHCAYPAGHAAIAGACTTILKAFFKNDFVIAAAMEPMADGSALMPYAGPALTIGAELDKLASNISIGRNIAGVHWRTDGDEGMRLGEQIGIGILRDYRQNRPEPIADFVFPGFDGQTIVV